MTRALAFCLVLGCHSPPSEPSPAPLLYVETLETGEDRVATRGLPALSADGHVIVTSTQSDYGQHFVYWNAHTGEVLREEPSPMQVHDPYREDRAPFWTIDDDDVAAINRAWDEAGFRPLSSYEEWIAAHPDADLRVSIESHEERDEETSNVLTTETLTVARGPWSITVAPEGEDGAAPVAVAPDGSFIVLAESGCACECGSWHSVVLVR